MAKEFENNVLAVLLEIENYGRTEAYEVGPITSCY